VLLVLRRWREGSSVRPWASSALVPWREPPLPD
jgi:hypothetical protein